MRDTICIFFILIMFCFSTCLFANEAKAPSEGAPQTKESEQQKGQIEELSEESSEGPSEESTMDESLIEASNTIRSIEFVGNKKFKDKVLLQRVGFEAGGRLDPFLVEGGRRTIINVYQKIGFTFVEVLFDKEKLSQGRVVYTINEGPKVKVGSVKFSGNKAISDGTLRKIIKMKKRKWFYWPYYYTEESLAQDIEKLENFYYEKGFLDYSIKVKKEFTKNKSKIRITFIIDEGPTYRIEKIVFTGNEYFTRDQLTTVMQLEPGQIYIKKKAEVDVKEITKLYREQGFVDAVIEQKPVFAPELSDNVVTVEFSIKEGKQFRIGRIEITGNELTQDRVVRHVLDEYDFTPGKLYNADMAPKEGRGKLEKYVQRTMLAEEVMIRPVPPISLDPNQKDVSVDVKEGLTGFISPGVGVSSDSGVIGRLVYQQQNFDISDWPESFKDFITMKAFRGAGQSLRLSFEPGTEVSQYIVHFTDPYFRDRPTELDVIGSSWERWRESYDEQRLRGYFSFQQRRKNNWRRSIGFRAENIDVHNLDVDAPQEIIDVRGSNILMGATLGLGRNAIDDIYDPSTGHTFSTSYEQVVGDHNFGILKGSYVRYWTLREDVLERKTVLAGKLLAATSIGNAPPFEKFYAGGSSAYGIRGFEYRGVSTRGLQTGVPDPQYKYPIGSDWIFLANAEIRVPLIGENFDGLIFMDSGTIDTGRYRVSIGAGIQITVPQWLGPLPMRFELATPIQKDDLDETQVFSFSFGTLF